jgi:acetyltransferase-like isoleucine patch superfamily enzyme
VKEGHIIVGENCWFGLNNVIMGPAELGNNISTGPYVCIVGPHHAVDGFDRDPSVKTVIGDDVWISTGSVILFGIQVGKGAIIAPGSVITKNVKEGAYVAGNPARDFSKVTKLGSTGRKP